MAFKYVALSYPWGDPEKHPHAYFETTAENIVGYMKSIDIGLPKTLADAITTTRALGLEYLWIDSLCIKQGHGGDFTQEAGRMETLFSSAYCVLAATSAEGNSSGFLSRASRREVGQAREHDVICFQYANNESDAPSDIICVDEAFDNFQKDVREGPLNKRGWVRSYSLILCQWRLLQPN